MTDIILTIQDAIEEYKCARAASAEQDKFAIDATILDLYQDLLDFGMKPKSITHKDGSAFSVVFDLEDGSGSEIQYLVYDNREGEDCINKDYQWLVYRVEHCDECNCEHSTKKLPLSAFSLGWLASDPKWEGHVDNRVWAIVHLMGHGMIAGRVDWDGVAFLHVVSPAAGDHKREEHYHGLGAIYDVEICDKERVIEFITNHNRSIAYEDPF